MVRPGLRPNTCKERPTRAPPEVFEANFSYGYEVGEKEARTAPNKFKQKATGHNGNGAESKATRSQQEAKATGHDGTQREATGHNGNGTETEATRTNY